MTQARRCWPNFSMRRSKSFVIKALIKHDFLQMRSRQVREGCLKLISRGRPLLGGGRAAMPPVMHHWLK